MFATAADITRAGLCTGCGVCAGLCPSAAVRMEENVHRGVHEAVVDGSACDCCGLCVRVCAAVGFDRSDARFLPRRDRPEHILGEHAACYLGAAIDEAVRVRGASGGMVTAVLKYLFERGAVDGAIVTTVAAEAPLRPRAVLCRTADEVNRAATSRYCPVEFGAALREALAAGGRYAAVGLPCHIASLAKAQHALPRVSEAFPVLLGLFCGHTPSFRATDYILWQSRTRPEAIASLSYRGEGWPGGVTVLSRDGSRVFYSHETLWRGTLGLLFLPRHCLDCADHVNLQADICFGDAWLPGDNDVRGTSVVVARTAPGERILAGMRGSHAELREIAPSVVACTQDNFTFARTQPARALVRRLSGRARVHHYHTEAYDRPTVRTVLASLAQSALCRVSGWKWMWPLFRALLKVRAHLLT